MTLGTRIATLAALLLVLAASSAVAGVRDDHPNLVGGELGGRGLVLTVNFEHYLSNQFGIGAGLMAVGGSGGLVTVVPVYVSYLSGDTHSLYLGAGGTVLTGVGSVHDWGSTVLIHGSMGYQYQSPGGLFVRPFFTIFGSLEQGNDGVLVWPGLTIGGSF